MDAVFKFLGILSLAGAALLALLALAGIGEYGNAAWYAVIGLVGSSLQFFAIYAVLIRLDDVIALLRDRK